MRAFKTPLVACVWLAIVAATWSEPAVAAQVRVGPDLFCVPDQNLVKTPLWLDLATRHLPDDGFRFVLNTNRFRAQWRSVPAKNIKVEAIPWIGTIVRAEARSTVV